MESISFVAGFGTVAQTQMGGGMQMDGWMGGGEWAQPLIMVVWALLLAVVVLAVVRVLFVPVLEGLDLERDERGDDRALATLRERYARGEIDEEEFERRESLLRGRGT